MCYAITLWVQLFVTVLKDSNETPLCKLQEGVSVQTWATDYWWLK